MLKFVGGWALRVDIRHSDNPMGWGQSGNGGRDWDRTSNRQLRRLMLYKAMLMLYSLVSVSRLPNQE